MCSRERAHDRGRREPAPAVRAAADGDHTLPIVASPGFGQVPSSCAITAAAVFRLNAAIVNVGFAVVTVGNVPLPTR